MKMTVAYAAERFSHFNALCFDGALPGVPIVLTRATTFLGKVRYKRRKRLFGQTENVDFQIRLSSEFELPENEWDDVIIHEMIHFYIARNNLRDTSTHGTVFRGMMDEINRKYGRHITVSHRTSPEATSPRMARERWHCICVSKFQDGTEGITVCSEAMAPRIERGLPKNYRIVSREWYVSNDVYFNRFPHSRLPRIYKITASDLQAHIATAVPTSLPLLRSGMCNF